MRLFELNKELLSKQDHYDWGLRAMTGVLRIAGGLKRTYTADSETAILMRALRDSNLPKFVSADYNIFLGLISDLFPKTESPRVANNELVAAVRHVIEEGAELQAEDVFVNKTIDLFDVLGIRHCVFILGAAGSGKSQVWRTLQAAQTHLGIGGGKSMVAPLNPKAVTSNELYGYVHPSTKEPYDGIIAKIMRDFSKMESQAPHYSTAPPRAPPPPLPPLLPSSPLGTLQIGPVTFTLLCSALLSALFFSPLICSALLTPRPLPRRRPSGWCSTATSTPSGSSR